jgi:cell division protein FtsB
MREELERALLATGKLRSENAELRRDISALKQDPRAIEEIARDELGMVFPDEVVIRVERGRQ